MGNESPGGSNVEKLLSETPPSIVTTGSDTNLVNRNFDMQDALRAQILTSTSRAQKSVLHQHRQRQVR